MRPVLFTLGGVDVPSYAVFVGLAFVVALLVRRSERDRIARATDALDPPQARVIAVAALVGAVIGSKLGMVLFASPDELGDVFAAMLRFDFSGKTIVGGVAGGWLGVEIAKKIAGITRRTGDVYALALPLGVAVGRVGCLLNGCCYGAPAVLPWSVLEHGTLRHPAPLYESALDLVLAAYLFATRNAPRREGRLFRESVLGVCVIRAFVETFRGDPSWRVGPFSAPQVVCVAAAVVIGVDLWLDQRRL